jgi:hypothetical protein
LIDRTARALTHKAGTDAGFREDEQKFHA